MMIHHRGISGTLIPVLEAPDLGLRHRPAKCHTIDRHYLISRGGEVERGRIRREAMTRSP